MNNLAQYLDQYDKLGIGGAPNVHGDSPWSGSFSRDTDAAARNSARTVWAMNQMRDEGASAARPQMPDYFGKQDYAPASYTPPQQFQGQDVQSIARNAGFPVAPGAREPQSGADWQAVAQQQHPNGPVYNFLANLLKGR